MAALRASSAAETRRLGRPSRLLGGVTQLFALLTDRLERLAVLVAEFAGFLGQSAKAFRVFAHRLVHVQAGVDRVATDGGLHALALAGDARALRRLPTLFGALAAGL